MVKFRRSMKGEKPDLKAHHISIPSKDATAIVPPKKVIKALYDYHAPNDPSTPYLSFAQGDFLHVVGREYDTEWYEACNPLHGSRGLVPVKYFDIIGKTVRDSSGSTKSGSTVLPSSGHDSGYAVAGAPAPSTEGENKPVRLSKLGKSGAMVYGIVMYDFKAERPDELDAKEGEAIIVIAQSNPEWFVAKPITRLGGPGLIPVSFIEIRDMTTGQPVPNALEAVQRAGVPKVEEWKKMAADYKNGSIPLGRLDSGSGQSMQQSLERLSLTNGSQGKIETNGHGHGPNNRNTGGYANSHYSQSSSHQLLAPVRAAVPRYCFAADNFWFIIDVSMEDGSRWELSRFYKDFYDLQISLIQDFPLEAGNVQGYERSLPFMPGPVTVVTENISNGRRANLDEYLKNLLKLGPHISQGFLVRRFFAPREGDYEIEPSPDANGYRLSANSAQSTDRSRGAASSQSSATNMQPQSGRQHHPSTMSQGYAPSSRTPSDLHPSSRGPPILRQNSALTQASASSVSSVSSNPMAMKIKVWFEEDNCVVLRMPPHFRFADLYQKLKDRRRLERGPERGDDIATARDDEAELAIEYRDDTDGQYYRISGDEDLQVAIERCSKLTLMVGVERERR